MTRSIIQWVTALLSRHFEPKTGWATATDTQYTRENPFIVDVGAAVVLLMYHNIPQ